MNELRSGAAPQQLCSGTARAAKRQHEPPFARAVGSQAEVITSRRSDDHVSGGVAGRQLRGPPCKRNSGRENMEPRAGWTAG
jgi:hypothetical protein